MKTPKFPLAILLFGIMFMLSSCTQDNVAPIDEGATISALGQSQAVADQARKGQNGPSASGHGYFLLPDDTKRQFTFHANTMPDGSVQGNGVLTYQGGELNIKFDIDCLSITGNTAFMSGVITSSNLEGAPVGTPCLFQVEDNGEGSKTDPDNISRLLITDAFPLDCANPSVIFFLYPVIGGNIQVKN
ncbi:MAG: hypothetical protein H6555_11250 [Lewinellaceae bacterium]|nr:hypothetical protein [Lewinellaceae bacterium]